MNKKHLIIALLALSTFGAAALADTLTLKNGKVIEGTFLGKTGDSIEFDAGGIKMTVQASDVSNLDLGASAASSATTPTPAAKEAPAAAPVTPTVAQDLEVPAGTALTIRLREPLSSDKNGAGYRFSAVLEGGLTAGDQIVIPQGSTVHGVVQQSNKSGRVAGQSSMALTLTQVSVNGVLKPIATSDLQATTPATGKQSTGRVLRGAALGGLVDGSDGAKTGAKVGAGAAILSRGNQVSIPAGTILEFQLRAPFKQ